MNTHESTVLRAVTNALGMVHDFGTATGQNPDIQNRALDAAQHLLSATPTETPQYRRQTVSVDDGDVIAPDGYSLAFAERGERTEYQSGIYVPVPVWHLIWAPPATLP